MKTLNPADFPSFLRQYRFPGSKLRRVRLKRSDSGMELDFVLVTRTAIRDLGEGSRPVRLHLQLKGLSEFRIQKRPTMEMKCNDVQLGYFGGEIFLNLDAWPLGQGERPGVHDFRASELYAAGGSLFWEEITRKKE